MVRLRVTDRHPTGPMRLHRLFSLRPSLRRRRRSIEWALPFIGLTQLAGAQDMGHGPAGLNLDALVDAAIEQSLSTVLYDAPAANVVHARGASYKAFFTAEGAQYVPFLGEAAPRNFPLGFRLEAATLGDQDLPLAAQPTVRREGDRVVIDHGSILEVYDLTPDSIEQSFVLPRRTARGEVRVRLAVSSELDGTHEGRGLRFDGAHGGVRYGEAFALDARGRRANVATTLANGVITLTCPDAFPIEGEGELVIDPVITTLSPISSAIGARNADVAFDTDASGGGTYVVTYETGFSATDRDVYAIEMRDSDGAIQNLGAIDISSANTTSPRVACDDGGDRFLVVYEREHSSQSGTEVWSRVRAAGTANASSAQRISPNSTSFSSYDQPDVGGDNRSSAGNWGVVFRRSGQGGSIIQARGTSSSGTPIGALVTLSAPGNVNDSDPTISEGNSIGTRAFAFAYTRRNFATDRDVHTGQLDVQPTGVILNVPAFSLGKLGDFHTPSVSNLTSELNVNGDPLYAVTYQGEAPGDSNALVSLVAGSRVESLNNLTQMENSRFAQGHETPVVAWTGQAFVFAYSARDGVFMATAHVADRGDRKVLALAERYQPARHNNNSSNDIRPAVASAWESGRLGSAEATLAFDMVPAGGAFRTVQLARIEAFGGSPAIGTQYCEATFNSAEATGWLSMFGSQTAGTQKVAIAQDLPVGQFALMINSQTPGLTIGVGGSNGNLCLGGSIGRMNSSISQVLHTGSAFFFVNPANLETADGFIAAQPGQTWHFQVWFRDTFAGQPTSNLTNAVRVELR